ncbi:MAG TPA: ABC transporter ATP-binding protein [Candidatus Saccharibacteria bacterium]|nr:ABC transporter ATP-binding protein [Candidatus Saccharibacteria bacterium]
MAKEIALQVKNVSKSFRLPTEQASGVKQAVINRLKGIKGYKEQKVLKDISFTIEKGDFFGIVGRNGSGKSTLLKIISQIYQPDKGQVIVSGSLVPFIELGVGFNPELTGRENVYVNGALLGFSPKQIGAMYDDIVDFAELHDFMDQKLKNYSSGMQVRLAFSVAIKAEADILILDEVLAVGDESFQKKCYSYFAQLRKKKRTVILVTHSMEHVQQFCTKALMLDSGKIVNIGNPSKVAQSYRELFIDKGAKTSKQSKGAYGNGIINNDYFSARISVDQTSKNLVFKINTHLKTKLEEDVLLAFGIVKESGEQVYRWASDERVNKPIDLDDLLLTVEIDNIFPEGNYSVLFVVKSLDRSIDYGIFNESLFFTVTSRAASKWDMFWKPKENFKISVKEKGV